MRTETGERAYTPWWTFAVLVVAGLVAIAGFVSSASESPMLRSYAHSEVAGKGTPVQDGKLEFTVTKVRGGLTTIGDPYYGTTPAGGSFTTAALEVTNASAGPATFDTSYVVGVTADGDKLPSDREATYFANPQGSGTLATLEGGEQLTITVVFDLPDDVRLTGLQVHDSVFSRGAVIAFER